jgi:serine/threonine protein kinase
MGSPSGDNDDNWLRDFVASAFDDVNKPASPPAAPSPQLPRGWLGLIDGPAPGESIDPIGPYQIQKRLGRGGMGVVYQAYDSALRRVVAIKFLSPRLAVMPLARARFTREAQAAAAINHPNVVTIHAIGEYEGLPYLVMEYVAGVTLAERVNREGMLQLKSILRIGIQMARGLAAAHSQGSVHRDIKPANVLLESGIDRVKITDFGLACVTSEPWRLTASGVLLGTPAYMSPEQAGGAAVDHRSDLFSLGSVLYHLCTGETPFPGPTVKAILGAVRERQPRPIRDMNPDISRALENHIGRLLAKNPDDRFASASELVRTLAGELAVLQGMKPDQSVDDPDSELDSPEPLPAVARAGKFEIVESWDDIGPLPLATSPKRASRSATWVPRNSAALKFVALAAALVVAAVALISGLVWTLRNSGEDLSISLLVALAFVAVLIWAVVQLRGAVLGHRLVEERTRGPATVLRHSLAASALFLIAGTAYLEWSARAQAKQAFRVVSARHAEKSRGDLTRKEIESIIGRAADEVLPPDRTGALPAIYRWNGVFRSYQLHAEYRRKPGPAQRPTYEDTGSDVLIWIVEVFN